MPVATRPLVMPPKMAMVMLLRIVPLPVAVAVTVIVTNVWVPQVNVELDTTGLRRGRSTDPC